METQETQNITLIFYSVCAMGAALGTALFLDYLKKRRRERKQNRFQEYRYRHAKNTPFDLDKYLD